MLLFSVVPAINGVPFNREDFTNNDSIAKLFGVVEDAICALLLRTRLRKRSSASLLRGKHTDFQ